MSKHTPGPWQINPKVSTAVMGHDYLIAACGGYSNNTRDPDDLLREQEANARLIAAAPDLLAALRDAALVINAMHTKTLPQCFAPTLEMVNAINYAIAKAEAHA